MGKFNYLNAADVAACSFPVLRFLGAAQGI